MRDLSIIIPGRNEMFLRNTVDDILAHKEADTEIIVIADGNWPNPGLDDHEDVSVVYHSESVGQRAATNEGVRLSRARFVMKADAHCAFDQGFDRKMMETCEYDWTAVPRMYNLHAFNWKCSGCGNETYQGPTPTTCGKCGSVDFERKMIWQPRKGTKSDSMMFDKNLHFQYWREYTRRPEAKGPIADTMSLIGACWMMHRQRYWDLDGMDEAHGSWGQMGTEISCKTWLSGGRLIVNKNTWFAHMFRTQGGDFGFPYEISGKQVEHARAHSRKLWQGGTWPKAKYPLSWLIRRFAPVPTWEEQAIPPKSNLGLVYYTHHKCDSRIWAAVQKQIDTCRNGWDVVSVSLKPMTWGRNIVLNLQSGYLTMFKQILAGLEASTAEYVFLVEHDVLYHPSHFEFVPQRKDVFYYDENRWFVETGTGRALFYNAMSTSMLCADRQLLIGSYRKRIARVESEGFSYSLGFEPGNHKPPRGVDDEGRIAWMSKFPSIDVRHGRNLTKSRWSQEEFRNKRNLYAWTEGSAYDIPGWDRAQLEEVLAIPKT